MEKRCLLLTYRITILIILDRLSIACWRILRCNPFSHGGFDPVRDEFTLKVGPMDPAVYHGETEQR